MDGVTTVQEALVIINNDRKLRRLVDIGFCFRPARHSARNKECGCAFTAVLEKNTRGKINRFSLGYCRRSSSLVIFVRVRVDPLFTLLDCHQPH